jgi:hypothetical protein
VNTITRSLLVACGLMVADALAVNQHPCEAVEPPAGKKVLVDDTLNDAQLKQILAKGYRPTSQARSNEVLYCRSERELGSRFEKKVCKTATRIIQDELHGKEATTRLEQTSGNVRSN